MAFDEPVINLKGFLHSGITEFVIPSWDLFLTDLGVAAREGTTGVASDVKEKKNFVNYLNYFVLGRREEKRKLRRVRQGHLGMQIHEQKLLYYVI